MRQPVNTLLMGTDSGSSIPDYPTAEPLRDLMAQANDLVDPYHPRQAVYIAPPQFDNHRTLGLLHSLRSAGVPVDNFDGKGGMLIAKNQAIAGAAVKARDAGAPMQRIIGQLTGAGDGKPIDGAYVVQQLTKDGAVARESVVRSDDVDKIKGQFAAPGRTVEVLTPHEALQRRHINRKMEEELI